MLILLNVDLGKIERTSSQCHGQCSIQLFDYFPIITVNFVQFSMDLHTNRRMYIENASIARVLCYSCDFIKKICFFPSIFWNQNSFSRRQFATAFETNIYTSIKIEFSPFCCCFCCCSHFTFWVELFFYAVQINSFELSLWFFDLRCGIASRSNGMKFPMFCSVGFIFQAFSQSFASDTTKIFLIEFSCFSNFIVFDLLSVEWDFSSAILAPHSSHF